jgi:hypothetical protein
VAEAQLTNITRQKFKEAYDLHTAAIIERAEKQILLANQARHLLNLLDDTPIVPGEERPTFAHADAAREVLNEAEASLRNWSPTMEPIATSAGKLGANAMPGNVEPAAAEEQVLPVAEQRVHSGAVAGSGESAQTENHPPYLTSEAGASVAA